MKSEHKRVTKDLEDATLEQTQNIAFLEAEVEKYKNLVEEREKEMNSFKTSGRDAYSQKAKIAYLEGEIKKLEKKNFELLTKSAN